MTKTKKQSAQIHFRQGDVFLVACERREGLKEVPRDGGRIIVAAGEATGHHHAIASLDATMLIDDAAVCRYLDVRAPSVLCHEEHAKIDLPSGFYEVRIQRTYTPQGLKRVVD